MATLAPVDFNPFGTTPDDFVEKFRPAADLAAERLGVSPKVLLAQFGHETGWGKHIIPGTNNLGNIKDFSGKGVSATDSMLGTKDKYRVYGSPEEFAEDFANLITKRYGAAVGAGDDPVKFARALKAGGYAEDPAYISKVVGAHRAISKPAALVPVDFNPFSKEEAAPAKQDYNADLAKAGQDARRDSMHPAIRNIIDFAHGATGASRGAMNLLNKVAPSQFSQQEPSALVTPGFSGAKLAGSLADPAALGIGGAAMRAIPYAPVLGSGAASGARAVAQNLAGGAVPGAALGALNAAAEGGNSASGAGTGAAIGAAANMVIPPALQGLGTLAGKAMDLLRGRYGDAVAARILQQAAGDDLQAIKTLAQNADPGLTAAQAVAPANNTQMAALGEFAARSKPDAFNRIAQRQAQERIDALARVAGGDTQTASMLTQGADRKALLKAADPMIAKELDAVNRGAIKPLDTDAFDKALASRMTARGTRMNDLQSNALAHVRQKLADAKEMNGGIVDAYDLYEIRKTAIDFSIQKLLPGDPSAQAKQAAKLLGEVRPLIDQAIEDAGGAGWRKYLDTFSQHMNRIERKEMGATLLGQLKDSPEQFVKTARGDNPDAVRSVFDNEFSIQRAMGEQMPEVSRVAGEVSRDAALRENAKKGAHALGETINSNYSRFHLPNLLNRHVMLTNRIMSEVESRVNKRTAESLVKAMESGRSLADAINFIPLADRTKVIKALNDSPYLKAAALNQATQQ